MKKAKVLVLLLGLMVLLPGSAAMAFDLFGFGSYWDKQDLDGTWGGGLGLGIPLFSDYFMLEGRAYFFENSDFGTDELKMVPFDVGLQIHVLPGERVDPYILGGVSYVWVDEDKIEVDSNASGYVGAGLDVELGDSNFLLFGEALYRFNELETEFEEDIDVSGFTGNVGLKVRF